MNAYILFLPLSLDLDGNQHGVKERCEVNFIRTQEEEESDCPHPGLRHHATADVMDVFCSGENRYGRLKAHLKILSPVLFNAD